MNLTIHDKCLCLAQTENRTKIGGIVVYTGKKYAIERSVLQGKHGLLMLYPKTDGDKFRTGRNIL